MSCYWGLFCGVCVYVFARACVRVHDRVTTWVF